jgi:zinc transporter ZupT
VALLALLGLLGAERLFRRRGETSRLSTSYRIALGIGLHNLGEGLAIGAAFALGEAALGTFLVLGFTLHNITEGVGIAAPILEERPHLAHFAGLALLGGGPLSWGPGSVASPTPTSPRQCCSLSGPAQYYR